MKTKVIAALLVLSAGAVFAQTVEVKDAWVRAAVPGQSGTGAFMNITAKDGAKLVGVSSPVAGVTEVHEMKMENDIMRMRAIPALDLPAGKTVALKPGGYHVMLMELKQALPPGGTVPLTLILRDAKGQESKVELKLPVAASMPGAGMPASGMPGAMQHKH
ncbi:MAG: copper chaperone PCu(A)C [Polaromonas sp.]|uniref:copper chaperone PCu(A)C n=1 Tax=Polaromonas sp. TaxID=1869339 RepID=UPI00273154F1|nr:copper chaperone PCu(A)C [Polaromonas sp.]MDP2450021.1 copper chaperone PCu(A)C [Polaromonas sp.]MDP3247710.1 copper chaperone PCu(A)C [Polaromonas sp.]MDP3757332.1 copper chaperone PCu(A)C [Polaromonas sp.]MDP3826336.1 copper chaperone PCu(A)C [Polaromonas sp.]